MSPKRDAPQPGNLKPKMECTLKTNTAISNNSSTNTDDNHEYRTSRFKQEQPCVEDVFHDPDLSVEDVLALPSFYNLGVEKARELIRLIGVVCETTYSIFSRSNKDCSSNETNNPFHTNANTSTPATIPLTQSELRIDKVRKAA